jgi:hypothetical protein
MAGHLELGLGQQPCWTGRVSAGTVRSMSMGAVTGDRILHLTHHTGVSRGSKPGCAGSVVSSGTKASPGTEAGSGAMAGGVSSMGAMPSDCILNLLHNTSVVGARMVTRHSGAMAVSMPNSQHILHLISNALLLHLELIDRYKKKHSKL